jgi:hypothetical protein
LKLFGEKYPFSFKNQEENIDFPKVVVFELPFENISGMEFTNTLFKYGSRMVYEANDLVKKCFDSLSDFFKYYEIHSEESYFRSIYTPTNR